MDRHDMTLSFAGDVEVVTSREGGHPPEFFARRIVDRLIYIGDSAPDPLRDQAYAYRDQMYAVVLAGLKAAIESDRAYRTKGE
jgi:hypothetical protein